MTHAAKLNALQQRCAEFLLQFPCECDLRRFAFSNLSAGKFPLQRGSIALPALADQKSPVATLNHRRYYGYHSSAPLRVPSVSALSLSPPLASSVLVVVHIHQCRRAPSR